MPVLVLILAGAVLALAPPAAAQGGLDSLRGPVPLTEEPTPPRLAPEKACFDHAREQRRRGVERLLELRVQAVGDRHRRVQADEVGQVEWAHGVVAAFDHARVDVLGGGEA